VEKEGFDALTRDDVKTVLEQQADLALLGGDADGAALAALGSAVGAQHVIAAVVSSVDGDTVVQLRLIDSSKMSVLARRELRASETGGELLRAVEDCTRLVLQPLFSAGRGTLLLALNEEGADVLVDGKQVAVSPRPPEAVIIGLSAGYHLVTASKKGFVSFQETVRVQNGDTLEKTATLVPSVEFLKEYRERNGTYRALAWTTTGVGTLAAAAVAVSAARVQKEITDNNIANGTAEFAAKQAEVTAARNQELPWAIATPTSAVVLGVGALLAGYFWIFGDDPDRYAPFEAEAGLR
jgi:hypothetical protein